MKVSTRGRYGVNAMYELAINYGQKAMPMKLIAANQNIPENYLEQLLSHLRQDGLIQSTRGAHGGYKLSKPPEEIAIGEILYSLEGPMAPVDCVVDDNTCQRMESGTCAGYLIWKKVYKEICNVVDNISLDDLIKENEIK